MSYVLSSIFLVFVLPLRLRGTARKYGAPVQGDEHERRDPLALAQAGIQESQGEASS